MTPEQLFKIEARANAATEGPWGPIGAAVVSASDGMWIAKAENLTNYTNDRAFIAHSRTDIPALIEAVRARDKHNWLLTETHRENCKMLDKRIAELESALRQIHNMGQSAVPDHWDFRVKARQIAIETLTTK